MAPDTLPPALLVDLDDTILTFTAGPRDFWTEAFEAHAQGLPGIGVQAFRSAIRHAADRFWADPGRAFRGRQDLFAARRRVVAGAFERLGRDPGPVGRQIADHYTRTKEESCAPFPGALEALDSFRRRGMRLALVTNGSSAFQRAKIERYDLARFFDAILVEGELGVGKPDARVFQAALDALGVRPTEAWMIGDNLHADIAGAQALGIAGVWHDYSRAGLGDDPPVVPRRVMHAWAELLEERALP